MFKDGPQDSQDLIHISLEANQKSWKGKGKAALHCKSWETCPRPRCYPYFFIGQSKVMEGKTKHDIAL